MIKTVTTYYCDRCGEKMASDSALYCDTHPKTAIQILLNKWEYADLCDECKESFKVWWEKSSVSPTDEVENRHYYAKDGKCSACELEKESNTDNPNCGKFVAC